MGVLIPRPLGGLECDGQAPPSSGYWSNVSILPQCPCLSSGILLSPEWPWSHSRYTATGTGRRGREGKGILPQAFLSFPEHLGCRRKFQEATGGTLGCPLHAHCPGGQGLIRKVASFKKDWGEGRTIENIDSGPQWARGPFHFVVGLLWALTLPCHLLGPGESVTRGEQKVG